MPNIYDAISATFDGLAVARVGELAGSTQLGMSIYELQSGQGMVFHYHLQREELLVVLRGTLALRTASGWQDLPEGEVVAFPRGEYGAHGYENRTTKLVRLLMASEQNAPNISVYPDTNEIGIFDAAKREERRFGALFSLDAAISDYGGGKAKIAPPAPPQRHGKSR
jgi:uncharacterized cupin superfamily protein